MYDVEIYIEDIRDLLSENQEKKLEIKKLKFDEIRNKLWLVCLHFNSAQCNQQ